MDSGPVTREAWLGCMLPMSSAEISIEGPGICLWAKSSSKRLFIRRCTCSRFTSLSYKGGVGVEEERGETGGGEEGHRGWDWQWAGFSDCFRSAGAPCILNRISDRAFALNRWTAIACQLTESPVCLLLFFCLVFRLVRRAQRFPQKPIWMCTLKSNLASEKLEVWCQENRNAGAKLSQVVCCKKKVYWLRFLYLCVSKISQGSLEVYR